MQQILASLWAELVDAATDVAQELEARLRPPQVVTLVSDEQHILRTEHGEPLESAGPDLASASCRILLPPQWFYRVELAPIPEESRPFLEPYARQQIERVTPWREADVFATVTHLPLPDDPKRLLPALTVVPKNLIASEISALTARRCATVSICSAEEAQGGEIVVSGGERRTNLKRAVAKGLAATCGGLAVILVLCWWQAAEAGRRADDLKAQLNEVRAEIVKARAGIAGSLQTSGSRRPQVVMILEDLSKTLPDNAYLTHLDIDGDRATIAGIALDPPQLVGALENSGRFSAVSFVGETTRIEGSQGSRFTLQMQVTGEKAAVP